MRIVQIDEHPFWSVPYLNAGRDGQPHRAYLPVYRGTVDHLPAELSALILASDLQGREDAPEDRLLGLILAEHLEMLQESGELPPAQETGVVLAGDLYGVPGSTKRGGGGDVTEVWIAFAERFRWVTGVLGNHDHIETKGLPENADVLDFHCIERNGLSIAGLSGIIGEPKRPNRREAHIFAEMIEILVGEAPDILVLHQGPDRRPNPEPTVENALRDAQDQLVICGHAHWETPLQGLPGNVQVLNVDARVVVLSPQR